MACDMLTAFYDVRTSPRSRNSYLGGVFFDAYSLALVDSQADANWPRSRTDATRPAEKR
jgi:hypothetical protein